MGGFTFYLMVLVIEEGLPMKRAAEMAPVFHPSQCPGHLQCDGAISPLLESELAL